MKIGILETGEVAEDLKRRHGDYPAMFQRLLGAEDPTLEFATVSVVKGEMPAGPHQADGWLITGSRHGVYDDLPWIGPLKQFVRDCIAARVPVVGICFGHQLLAEALGGRVEKSAKGWGVGVHDYHVVSRPGWMTDLPAHFSVGAMHQDQIVEKPAEAHVLATSPFCEYAALAYGDPEDPTAISVQPHPEFEPGFLDELIAMRSGTVIPPAVAEQGRASLERPIHAADWARWIVEYLHRAAQSRAAA